MSGDVSIFIKAGRGSNPVEALGHAYRPEPRRGKAEYDPGKDRVLGIFGDLKGEGIITRNHHIDAAVLIAGSGHLGGRKMRKLIASLDDETDPQKRKVLVKKLEKAIRKLMDKIAPNSKWIAIIHGDRNHVHAHVEVENWDRVAGRRLNINPTLLSDLNAKKWSDDFVPCKGRAKQLDPDYPQDERSQKIADLKKRAAVRHIAAVEKAAQTIKQNGADHLAANKRLFVLDVHGNGKTRNNPVLVIDGVRFRFDRLRSSGVTDMEKPEKFLPYALSASETSRFEKAARKERQRKSAKKPASPQPPQSERGVNFKISGETWFELMFPKAEFAELFELFPKTKPEAEIQLPPSAPASEPYIPITIPEIDRSWLYNHLRSLGYSPQQARAIVRLYHRMEHLGRENQKALDNMLAYPGKLARMESLQKSTPELPAWIECARKRCKFPQPIPPIPPSYKGKNRMGKAIRRVLDGVDRPNNPPDGEKRKRDGEGRSDGTIT